MNNRSNFTLIVGLPEWLSAALGDEELARIIDNLNKKIPEENLGEKLVDIVQKRILELQLTH
jgi:hypothetical protein